MYGGYKNFKEQLPTKVKFYSSLTGKKNSDKRVRTCSYGFE